MNSSQPFGSETRWYNPELSSPSPSLGDRPPSPKKAEVAVAAGSGRLAAARPAPGSKAFHWPWKWVLVAVGPSSPRSQESDPKTEMPAGQTGLCTHPQRAWPAWFRYVWCPRGAPIGGLCLSLLEHHLSWQVGKAGMRLSRGPPFTSSSAWVPLPSSVPALPLKAPHLPPLLSSWIPAFWLLPPLSCAAFARAW